MRKPRLLQEGATYHVTARINRNEFLFKSDTIKKMFLHITERAKESHSFQLWNFCIMGNHIHFMIRPTKGESLSRIMQWILGVFARMYNRVFNLHGHVWYDRFKSKVIVSFRQYVNTFVYIAHNPVKAGIVDDPVDYHYSGIACYHKGILGILERPPNRILRILWTRLKKIQ